MKEAKDVENVLLNECWKLHKESFKNWLYCRNISDQTKKDYLSSLTKFFANHTVSSPKELRSFIIKDKTQRGLRNFFNYFEDEEIENPCGYYLDKWRKHVKIQRSGVSEVYITDEEVKEAYENCPKDIEIIFKLLVSSGSRLSHLYQMLQNFDETNVIIDDKIAHYPTSAFSSSTKKTFQIFFPTHYISEINSLSYLYKYKNLTRKLNIGRVNSKAIRKWHLNVMIEEGVPEGVAEFVQGRAATTVGSAHYLNKVKQAKTEYRKIVERVTL